jgi:hypothetical protein
MGNQEMPTISSVRTTREYLAANEAYLRGEHYGYENAKNRAMTALNLAGGNPDVSAEDHTDIVERRGALLVSEIGKTKDRAGKQRLAEQLRSLADQVEDARFDIAKDAGGRILVLEDEIVTVELMLLELREERRRYIENLRQAIDVTSGPGLILECCALIEEDITASLAAGDLDGARRSTASLATVRTLLPQEDQKEADPAEEEPVDDIAHYLAAAVIGDRSHGVLAADAKWLERSISRHLALENGENRERDAVRAALLEYRRIDRGSAGTTTAEVDPKGALVHGRA